MPMAIHSSFLGGSARLALAAGCLIWAAPSFAAPTESQPADGTTAQSKVEDIVVTARKRAENLQEVPTAVTALGAEKLADLQIQSFQDVGKTVPNVLIQKQAGSPTAPQFNIRGISAGSINFQVDSGIALYIDGVYLGRPGNSGFDLADLERLEVLRGPQGTLFGRNSTGGAISFTTASPTGQFGLILDGTLGNYERRRGRITLNTPEWNGFSARITYVHDENDGYVKNSSAVRRTFIYPAPFGPKTAADSFGANNIDSVLAAVRYDGIKGLTLDYKYDYTHLVTTIDAMQLLNAGATFTAITNFNNQPAMGGTNVVSLKPQDSLPIDGIAPSLQRTWGHSLTGTYEFNDSLSLKYIASLRGFTVNTESELDGNSLVDPAGSGKPYQVLAAIRYARQRQWSQELQLLGKTKALDWVAGLFYFHESAYLDSPVSFGQVSTPGTLIPVTNPGSYLAGGALQRILNKSFAAYAHANLHVTDRLELGAGIRYSNDNRTENDLLNAPRTPPRGKHSATQGRVDYDATVKYSFADHSNVYAKFATGFVSGGVFNSVEFKPETVKSYEIGVKSEFLNQRVRVNADIFQSNSDNLQVSGFLVGPGNVLINSGSQRSRGIEVETTVVPIDGVTLSGNYGFTDIHTSAGVRSYQPRNSAYLAAEFALPELGNGLKLSFRIDGQYIGKHYRLLCPAGSTTSQVLGCTNLQNADYALDKALTIPATWQLGARLSLANIEIGGARGTLSIWGKNLNNSRKFEYLFSVLGTQVLGTFQNPRTYGVDFRVTL